MPGRVRRTGSAWWCGPAATTAGAATTVLPSRRIGLPTSSSVLPPWRAGASRAGRGTRASGATGGSRATGTALSLGNTSAGALRCAGTCGAAWHRFAYQFRPWCGPGGCAGFGRCTRFAAGSGLARCTRSAWGPGLVGAPARMICGFCCPGDDGVRGFQFLQAEASGALTSGRPAAWEPWAWQPLWACSPSLGLATGGAWLRQQVVAGEAAGRGTSVWLQGSVAAAAGGFWQEQQVVQEPLRTLTGGLAQVGWLAGLGATAAGRFRGGVWGLAQLLVIWEPRVWPVRACSALAGAAFFTERIALARNGLGWCRCSCRLRCHYRPCREVSGSFRLQRH